MHQTSCLVGPGGYIASLVILSIPTHDESIQPCRDGFDRRILTKEAHQDSLGGDNRHGNRPLEFR